MLSIMPPSCPSCRPPFHHIVPGPVQHVVAPICPSYVYGPSCSLFTNYFISVSKKYCLFVYHVDCHSIILSFCPLSCLSVQQVVSLSIQLYPPIMLSISPVGSLSVRHISLMCPKNSLKKNALSLY